MGELKYLYNLPQEYGFSLVLVKSFSCLLSRPLPNYVKVVQYEICSGKAISPIFKTISY